MNRRKFAATLPVAVIGAIACGDGTTDPVEVPVSPPPPIPPPLEFSTAEGRALGVVASLMKSAERNAATARWPSFENNRALYPQDLYDGQAGTLTFLAEAYRYRNDPALKQLMEDGARSLRSTPGGSSRGLFDGNAGKAWAFLSIHQALGAASSEWLQAAVDLAPSIAAAPGGLIGDIINGAAGQGLFLLQLHEATGDSRWIDGARRMGDAMLDRAVTSGGGIKIPSFNDPSGVPVCYTGLAHGSAGAGYFLSRLARQLPGNQRARYSEGAESIARWLDGLAQDDGKKVYWYRREPDQMDARQVTWCHGPPGIGLFYLELYRLTKQDAHIEMARKCAATVDANASPFGNACQCHGMSGNAQLSLAIYRETGESPYLDAARRFGDTAWERRIIPNTYPAWPSGDGANVDRPGLMTGTSGIGWFYLQLATEGRLAGPVTT